jgi:dienelactone hydrolase
MIKMPQDIDAVKLPLSVAVGDVDRAMKKRLVLQMKEILEVKKKGDHEVVVLPGAKHGFAIRVDPKDEVQAEYAERAEMQAVAWFSRWSA